MPTIAIHERKGSFSDRWIEWCKREKIAYKIVNCFDNNVLSHIQSCDALLWHWVHYIPKDVILAKNFIRVLESSGKPVFPDINTCWHYDDKIAQKYLLESIDAKIIPTFVFYDLDEALTWIEKTEYPKVFKLSKGSGSNNVSLVHKKGEAIDLAKKAFGPGVEQSGGYFGDVSRKANRLKLRKDYVGALLRFPKAYLTARRQLKRYPKERDYIYFQQFEANNSYDTRITIIGNRAFGFTRNVRKDDFRASGSGSISYDLERIDMRCVKSAFHVANRIGTQSLALDFVKTDLDEPVIVEISYCFMADAVHNCPGHWDADFNWHEGQLWPQDAIIRDLLTHIATTIEVN